MKSEGITSVELLKIDIEGAEFDVLIPFLEKNTVCQVLLTWNVKSAPLINKKKLVMFSRGTYLTQALFLLIFSDSNRNSWNSQESSRTTENDVPVSHAPFLCKIKFLGTDIYYFTMR